MSKHSHSYIFACSNPLSISLSFQIFFPDKAIMANTLAELLSVRKISERTFESIHRPERMGNTANLAYGYVLYPIVHIINPNGRQMIPLNANRDYLLYYKTLETKLIQGTTIQGNNDWGSRQRGISDCLTQLPSILSFGQLSRSRIYRPHIPVSSA